MTLYEKSITVDLAKATSLKKVGSAAYLVDKSRGLELILVHSERNRYAALSRLCTHAERHISYIRTRRVLMCNNANHSVFGLDGAVVKGPAPKPLRCYAVKVSKSRLDISL
ncbi:MAG TPA: Rieske 2Fe-2S domain-containing protein [Armatimonadota bacterium]